MRNGTTGNHRDSLGRLVQFATVDDEAIAILAITHRINRNSQTILCTISHDGKPGAHSQAHTLLQVGRKRVNTDHDLITASATVNLRHKGLSTDSQNTPL